MKSLAAITLTLFIFTCAPAPAVTAQGILDKIADTLTGAQDMTAVYKITVTDADGSSQTSTIKIWTLGEEKRMIKYTSPSSVKGIGFLVLGEDEMYFYSPSRADVRRIAGHARNEGFHNTDFSYADMASYDYSADYTAELVETTDAQYKLKLVPKSGADTGYSSLYMWVNRDTWVFDRIDFYDSSGLVKRMTTGSVSVRDGYTTLGALLMVNQGNGHKTRITISSVEYDTGLESSFFSQRELKK
ncbi:MAG TPA: outer membrane lipoprotein-sorting protein [bacterium]|nr:outer membrane lipoprotein-sorting protein [bacterium]